jgi:transposase
MSHTPPIPESLWNPVPSDAQAAILAVLGSLLSHIAQQDQRIADLEARLQLNSTNSSKPPSSDPIGLKRKPPATPTGRKPGGQPGHTRAQRPLVPPEELRSSTDCRPTSCRRCAHPLLGDDPEPLIHQVADLPRIQPIVDQFRLHRLTCSHCGATTCGTLPEGVPTGHFSPYTQAVLATLAGAYRLSKRPIQQLAADLFGLTISTGMISQLEKQSAQSLTAPYHELARTVTEAEAVNIDETGWREDRRKAWLWVTVTALGTVFTIARNRSARVARGLLGDKEDQVVSSDRFKSYDWLWAY